MSQPKQEESHPRNSVKQIDNHYEDLIIKPPEQFRDRQNAKET